MIKGPLTRTKTLFVISWFWHLQIHLILNRILSLRSISLCLSNRVLSWDAFLIFKSVLLNLILFSPYFINKVLLYDWLPYLFLSLLQRSFLLNPDWKLHIKLKSSKLLLSLLVNPVITCGEIFNAKIPSLIELSFVGNRMRQLVLDPPRNLFSCRSQPWSSVPISLNSCWGVYMLKRFDGLGLSLCKNLLPPMFVLHII